MVFNGIIRQLDTPRSNDGEFLQLICDGTGYPLIEMVCRDEYGLQSDLTTTADTIYEIIRNGIIPGWITYVLGNVAHTSGYTITVTSGANEYIEDIAGTIEYVNFPYKPVNKCIQDLCDLVQAIKGTNAGPHWIVTTDSKLFLSTIGAHHAAVSGTWPNYYGGSQANATLEQDIDFQESNLPRLAKESNYIIYIGQWRKPSNGDVWTNDKASSWGKSGTCTLTDTNTQKMVGTKSLRANSTGPAVETFYYPSAQNAAWDFNAMSTPSNIPTLNFYARFNANIPFVVYLYDDLAGTKYFYYNLQPDLTVNQWSHFRLPIGPYWGQYSERKEDFHWSTNNSPVWTSIDFIQFSFTPGNVADYVYVDGLHFGGVPVIRIAREAYPGGEGGTLGNAGNEVKMKVIVDNVGKDDSYIASDDSGAVAQLAKAELLRCQTTPTVGTITTPLIMDLLPGELLHLHAKKKSDGTFNVNSDFRVLQLTHSFGPQGYFTTCNVTSDLKNANARRAFTDMNLLLSAIRPNFQDRQASSLKGGEIDIDTPFLEKYY